MAQLLEVDAPLDRVQGFAMAVVGDQFTQEAAVVIAVDRCIQAGGGEGLAQQGIELLDRHAHRLRNFLATGHRPQLVGQIQTHPANRREPFGQVYRQPDRARLTGDRPGHALANPPEGVGRKLVAPGGIKLFDSPLEPKGSFLDQVEQLHSLALIFLGNADNKPEVGFHHPLFAAAADPDYFIFMVAIARVFWLFYEPHHGLHLIAEFNLLGWCQQRHTPDRAEIPTDRITGAAAGAAAVRRARGCHGAGF